MKVRELASAVGKGLFAGVAGTASMTVSSALEMKRRQRPPSSVPARAAARVLGVEPTGDHQQERFSNLVHWSYGMAGLAPRGREAWVWGARGRSEPKGPCRVQVRGPPAGTLVKARGKRAPNEAALARR